MPLEPAPPEKKQKPGCLKIGLILLGVVCLTAGLTFWLAKAYIFPKAFKPVELNAREAEVLNAKINSITATQRPSQNSDRRVVSPEQSPGKASGRLEPERYSEKDADREIRLTERELNGLLARNTDLAEKLAIDLSDNLASAKLLVPLDPEFPFLGGKTLKVTAGLELRYTRQKPVVILRGVSIWGVPVPNAWLGGIKNIDLVREFGMEQGFWHTFAAGVDDIRIEEGKLAIKLKP